MTEDAPSLLGAALAGSGPTLLEGRHRMSPAATAPGDELIGALHGSSRASGVLTQVVRPGRRRRRHAGLSAGPPRVGVVVAGRDLELQHVSARARELCGCADDAAFREIWPVLGPALRRSIERRPAAPREAGPLLVEVCAGRTVQADLHRLDGPAGDFLVVLSDPPGAETTENDARLLRQLEGLGRVYRTLAHELRAPLGAVMLNLDLLHESLAGGAGGNDRAECLVEVLRRELDRLNRLLRGTFTQTVPEASVERFDLAGSLRDLVALLAPQARRQSVELELCLQDDPLPVRGYPDRLRQALLNVAVNALEAMPRGGRLLLEARRDRTWARIALRDTGPGIPPATLPRVYDPDFTTKDGGSGIGLHVARAVVELHGGEIGVSSQPGQGTAVLVAVPLASAGP